MRTIQTRTRGSQHGFIRRMISPGDLGLMVKPFVFLEYVHGRIPNGAGFGWHPHSGIATLTYSLNTDVSYEDTAGQKGTVEATGLEWMRAGEGTWHQAKIHSREELATSFQVWFSLPPDAENGPSQGMYVAPNDVPQVGNVRVLLGEYGGQKNPIPAPSPITYLDIVLAAGASWSFAPPEGHTVAWAMVYRGEARIAGEAIAGELVVLDEGREEIAIEATTTARVLFGSAKKHEHPLVMGSHSVHTSEAALAKGVARIREVAGELKRAGRM